jgi:hypothetical protein
LKESEALSFLFLEHPPKKKKRTSLRGNFQKSEKGVRVGFGRNMSILLIVPSPAVFNYVIARVLPAPTPQTRDMGQSSRISASEDESTKIFKVRAGPIDGMYPSNGRVKTCQLEAHILKGRDASLRVLVYNNQSGPGDAWAMEGTAAAGVFTSLNPLIDAIKTCLESPQGNGRVEEEDEGARNRRLIRESQDDQERQLQNLFPVVVQQPGPNPAEPRLGPDQQRRYESLMAGIREEDAGGFYREIERRLQQDREQHIPRRIIMGLPHIETLQRIFICEAIVAASLFPRQILHRASISPGITSDDYIWCCVPRPGSNGTMTEVAGFVQEWVEFNGEEAYGVVYTSAFGRDSVHGRTNIYTTMERMETRLLELIGQRGWVDREPRAEEVRRLAPAPPPPTFHSDRIDLSTYDPDDRIAIEALLDQDRRDGVLPPIRPAHIPSPPTSDVGGARDRFRQWAASQGLVGGTVPDVIQGLIGNTLPDVTQGRLGTFEEFERRSEQMRSSELARRENALAQSIDRSARIREMRAHRGTPARFDSGREDDDERPRFSRPPPLPFFQTHARPRPEPIQYHLGGGEPTRIPPPPPADPDEGWVAAGGVGVGGSLPVGPNVAVFGGRQGLVVGARPNNRLRDQVAARANARTARQIVDQATADVKKQIEPRLKKDDDIDAAALTADDNACVVCTSSHVTTMLFPCLHYQFCSGCISVWKVQKDIFLKPPSSRLTKSFFTLWGGKDEQKHEACPICRTKIEMVFQPKGKISVGDLRARSRAVSVSSAPISDGVIDLTDGGGGGGVPVATASAAPPVARPDPVDEKKDEDAEKESAPKKARTSKRKPAPKKKK